MKSTLVFCDEYSEFQYKRLLALPLQSRQSKNICQFTNTDFRSIATQEGGKLVNDFHPFPPFANLQNKMLPVYKNIFKNVKALNVCQLSD